MRSISESTIRRLTFYLYFLRSIQGQRENVSASSIAKEYGLNDVQVRKDLASVSGTGKPRMGYRVDELIRQVEECLGYNIRINAVLVGAGNLGRALLSYQGFAGYGLNIMAAFDDEPALVGSVMSGKPILPVEELEEVCISKKIELGIIAVPAHFAQDVCDKMVSSGIRAIWNFAPIILKTPEHVVVENENLASSLAILSQHLRDVQEK